MSRVSTSQAKRMAQKMGIDFSRHFDELSNSRVVDLLAIRRLHGYRAPQQRAGSEARYFFYYLKRR